MKKPLFYTLIIFTNLCFSQSQKVITASDALNTGELDKAKYAIDMAILDDTSKLDAKTWLTYGNVYYAIFTSNNESYKKLHGNPGKVALNSYIKIKELKKGEIYSGNLEKKYKIIQDYFLNLGVNDFNQNNYLDAIDKFKTANKAANQLGKIDSLALFNIALSYEKNKNFDEAINYYKECLAINYNAENCCEYIIFILKTQGKENEAVEFSKQCRIQFPKNQQLIITELNHYLSINKYNEALFLLEDAIENDPTNKILYYTNGTILNALGQNELAITNYKEALKLDDKYFDANYNLGALYFNSGADLINNATEITDNAKYNKIINEAKSIFNSAVYYLEKTHDLNPNDKNTVSSLAQLYAQLGQNEKYADMKRKLGALN